MSYNVTLRPCESQGICLNSTRKFAPAIKSRLPARNATNKCKVQITKDVENLTSRCISSIDDRVVVSKCESSFILPYLHDNGVKDVLVVEPDEEKLDSFRPLEIKSKLGNDIGLRLWKGEIGNLPSFLLPARTIILSRDHHDWDKLREELLSASLCLSHGGHLILRLTGDWALPAAHLPSPLSSSSFQTSGPSCSPTAPVPSLGAQSGGGRGWAEACKPEAFSAAVASNLPLELLDFRRSLPSSPRDPPASSPFTSSELSALLAKFDASPGSPSLLVLFRVPPFFALPSHGPLRADPVSSSSPSPSPSTPSSSQRRLRRLDVQDPDPKSPPSSSSQTSPVEGKGRKEKEKEKRLRKRTFVLRGKVLHGFRIGTKIGAPTANLDPDLPENAEALRGMPLGVYFGWARVKVPTDWPSADAGFHKVVLNVGRRPTAAAATGSTRVTVECFVQYSFQGSGGGGGGGGDLYGLELEVIVVGFLRPEIKFPSLDRLVERIRTDVGLACHCLDAADTRRALEAAAAALD